MANTLESEWELELEEELEGLGEGEHHEFESEFEHHEHHEHHENHELESEFEGGEQFFGKIFRGIGRFVKRAAPILKSIARVAAPMVGSVIGGPIGGMLGKAAASALREGEFEDELESHEHHEHHEFEMEMEDEFETHEQHEHHESQHEVAHEIAHHELTQHEALAEMLAEHAMHEQNEAQAEAMMGAAVVSTLSQADRRALRRVLPHLVRGVAVLTRILRKRRVTRSAVRAVPTIVRRTVQTLKAQAGSGQPITRKAAGRAAATEIRKVLGNPSACAAAIRQNVRSTRGARTRGVAG